MKIRFLIAYRTQWGEALNITLNYGSSASKLSFKNVEMSTTDGYCWSGEVDLPMSARRLEYSYQVVHCRLQFNSDGWLNCTILDTDTGDAYRQITENCLLAGYRPTSHITTARKFSVQEEETLDWQIDYSLPLSEVTAQLQEKVQSDQFRHMLFSDALETLIRKYCSLVTPEELESAVVALTETCMQLHPHETALRSYLFSTYIIFARQYNSVSLGLAFCKLFRKHFPGKPAGSFQKGVAKSIRHLTGREFSLDMDPTIPSEQPAYHGERPDYPTQLRLVQGMLYNQHVPPNEFAKQVGKLIRHYPDDVSPEALEAIITDLLDSWIPLYRDNPHLPNLLRGMHISFVNTYHSHRLGSVICQLAQKHLDDATAIAMEGHIRNADAFLQSAATESSNTERT